MGQAGNFEAFQIIRAVRKLATASPKAAVRHVVIAKPGFDQPVAIDRFPVGRLDLLLDGRWGDPRGSVAAK